MATTIQLRNVPEDLHRQLKARAALAGLSLSDYLLGHARALAARPTAEEMRARLSQREPCRISEPSAEIIRSGRDRDETPR